MSMTSHPYCMLCSNRKETVSYHIAHTTNSRAVTPEQWLQNPNIMVARHKWDTNRDN